MYKGHRIMTAEAKLCYDHRKHTITWVNWSMASPLHNSEIAQPRLLNQKGELCKGLNKQTMASVTLQYQHNESKTYAIHNHVKYDPNTTSYTQINKDELYPL